LGEYIKALEYNEKCLFIRNKIFGVNDSETQETIEKAKALHAILGKDDELPEWMNI
jgi:hypothetical protein